MRDSDLREFRLFAERLADAARAETLPRFRAGAEIVNKAGLSFDPVTDADREGERILRDMIGKVYPRHGLIGEEFGSERAGAEFRWVLDPVDGTRAFVCGAPTWTTLIALERAEDAILGVIDQPFSDERWIGAAGSSLHRRAGVERTCRVSGVTSLADARISTTDPRAHGYFSEPEAEKFARVARLARVARFSMDAYAYGLLALGEIDLVIETGLKRHDYAALKPVVDGAGGFISAWNGGRLGGDDRGSVVAAASRALHASAVEILAA